MSGTVMISIEGVLTTGELPNGQPIDTMIEFLFGIKRSMRVVVSSLCDSGDWVEHWLKMTGLDDVHYLKREPVDADGEDAEVRLRHVRSLRSAGHQLAFVVDTDAFVCSEIARLGVSTMCYTNSRHGQRRSVREWSEIEQTSVEMRRRVPPKPVQTADVG